MYLFILANHTLLTYVHTSPDHGYLSFTFSTPFQASTALSTYSFA
jgi:hypothetical protein